MSSGLHPNVAISCPRGAAIVHDRSVQKDLATDVKQESTTGVVKRIVLQQDNTMSDGLQSRRRSFFEQTRTRFDDATKRRLMSLWVANGGGENAVSQRSGN